MSATDDRMINLLQHHQWHWEAIEKELSAIFGKEKIQPSTVHEHQERWEKTAEKLGWLSFGGVDCPVDDPYGNAAMVIKAIKERRPD